MRLTIGTKMILAFLAVTLAVSTAGYLSLVVLEGVSLDSTGENLDDTLALATETIAHNIADRMDDLRRYAESASWSEKAAISNHDFDAMPDREERIAATERDWVADNPNEFIQGVLQGGLSLALKEHLDYLADKHGYPQFTEIFVTNKYGVVFAATGRTSDYQQSDEEWHQSAAANDSWIGDVAYDASSDSVAMDLVVALKDDGGATVGMIKGVLNIEYVTRLMRYIEGISRYQSTRAYLVNKQGRAIIDIGEKQGHPDLRVREIGKDLSATEVVSRALSVNQGHAVVRDGKKRVLAVFSRIGRAAARHETEKLGWALIMEYDADEVLQPILAAKRSLLMTSLTVALLTFLGGSLFSRSISGRIRRLTETAAEIAQANVPAKVEGVGGRDEIGILARTFNRMTENLFEAHSALEAQNTELEQFSYSVSHDLQTPLITIKGFLGILKEDLAAGKLEQVDGHLERISAAADKMSELLRDLLELSRVGRVTASPEEVPLGELVAEVLELADGNLRTRGVRVEVAPELPAVWGDRGRLLALWQNLVVNAAQHMGDRTDPRIQIDAREQDHRVVCRVSDNGVGIEPCYQEKIFELFSKLDKESGGTGIGLALAKRIVEIHKGRIRVESDGIGSGATFLFDLPRAENRDGDEMGVN